MHIVFLNGSQFRGSWHELTRALWHPLFIALVFAMTSILLLAQPYGHVLPEGVIIRTLIVTSSVMVFLSAAMFFLGRCARAKLRAHTIPVLSLSIICSTVWGMSATVLAGGRSLDLIGWGQLLAFNFVFCTAGEIILSSFLLRRIVEETGLQAHPIVAVSSAFRPDTQTQSQPPLPRTKKLEILGQPVALDAIWHLKAEEHYVLLGLRDGTTRLLRGRLADAIAQVPQDAGLQVHRSHWVARTALADLDRRRDGWRLRLLNGEDIPVARNRQAQVRRWVEAVLQPA